MYILSQKGVLVDIAKADCIRKNFEFRKGQIVFLIETDNGSEKEGVVLGEYNTAEEWNKAFENIVTFLNALDMRQFEEDED